jgi:hypothetical protein
MAAKRAVEKSVGFPRTLGLSDGEIRYGLDVLGETLRKIRAEQRAERRDRPADGAAQPRRRE